MKTTTNTAYYLQVVFLALIIGIGLQVATAWTPPTSAPPSQSVSAPVTIGIGNQVKAGGLSVSNLVAANTVQSNYIQLNTVASAGTSCTASGAVRYTGVDFEGCHNGGWISLTLGGGANDGNDGADGQAALDLYLGLHSSSQCTSLGGTVVTLGTAKVCKFAAPFPSGLSGWTQYFNWTTTQVRTCNGVNNGCGAPPPCTTGAHAWSNVVPEKCTTGSCSLSSIDTNSSNANALLAFPIPVTTPIICNAVLLEKAMY